CKCIDHFIYCKWCESIMFPRTIHRDLCNAIIFFILDFLIILDTFPIYCHVSSSSYQLSTFFTERKINSITVSPKMVGCSTCIACPACLIIENSLCRSEEHTSELQSRFDLVCRLLL